MSSYCIFVLLYIHSNLIFIYSENYFKNINFQFKGKYILILIINLYTCVWAWQLSGFHILLACAENDCMFSLKNVSLDKFPKVFSSLLGLWRHSNPSTIFFLFSFYYFLQLWARSFNFPCSYVLCVFHTLMLRVH